MANDKLRKRRRTLAAALLIFLLGDICYRESSFVAYPTDWELLCLFSAMMVIATVAAVFFYLRTKNGRFSISLLLSLTAWIAVLFGAIVPFWRYLLQS